MTHRVLVTGGAGFIGSHLCARLLRAGSSVYCLDDFSTGRLENIAPLLGDPRFELMRHDVVAPFDVHADEIYNLACPASPVHYQRDPIKTVRTSVLGALNVLDLAERTGARVLQTSTSEVYGDPLEHPQAETYLGHVSCTGRRACYDEGKRVAETLFFDYHRERGVDIRVARVFNTYGPHMCPQDGRVVANFVMGALTDQPLVVYGDGSQTRSFCFVDELVDGLVALMAADDPGTPVNLGNPEEWSVIELARLVGELAGNPTPIVRRAPLPDDPARRRPDITLAKRLLGWEPKVPLRVGLRRAIEYFRRELHGLSDPRRPRRAA